MATTATPAWWITHGDTKPNPNRIMALAPALAPVLFLGLDLALTLAQALQPCFCDV